MFDNLKAMGTLASLFRDKDRLRAIGDRLRDKAEQLRAEGQAGSGAVRVTANGLMRIVAVELSPAALTSMDDPHARALVEQLIVDATNDALGRAQDRMRQALEEEARALGLPGVPPELTHLLR